MNSETLNELVALSNRIGRPENDYAILGEGNTSARIDGESFYVKASGAELRTVDPEGFVAMSLARVMAMLNAGDMGDARIIEALIAAKVDGSPEPRPSVESLLHAICLSVPGVEVVVHTHPTAINALTCSKSFETLAAGRIFPDEVVVCGAAPCVVEYHDPGLPLARAVARKLAEFQGQREVGPKVILLQNHGMVALGASGRDAENITAMAVKSARVLMGTMAFGGPRFLPEQQVARIRDRSDEHYRQRIIGGG